MLRTHTSCYLSSYSGIYSPIIAHYDGVYILPLSPIMTWYIFSHYRPLWRGVYSPITCPCYDMVYILPLSPIKTWYIFSHYRPSCRGISFPHYRPSWLGVYIVMMTSTTRSPRTTWGLRYRWRYRSTRRGRSGWAEGREWPHRTARFYGTDRARWGTRIRWSSGTCRSGTLYIGLLRYRHTSLGNTLQLNIARYSRIYRQLHHTVAND